MSNIASPNAPTEPATDLLSPNASETDDPNLAISGLLQDLAHVYHDQPKRSAYRRAAAVVAGLDRPISQLVRNGRLAKLPGIGASIERLILEYLESGHSETVEHAVASASRDRQRSVARRRAVRTNYLSVARARQILLDRRPGAVRLEDYRGDLQQHSTWSDGSESVEEIIESSIALGQQYAAVTDHFALPVARGLNAADFDAQRVEIEDLNRRYGGRFRLLQGVEANILADGTIEMSREEMRRIEVVVASPHSLLHRGEDQTRRMVGAVQQWGVNILGHPRGRRYSERPGVQADWDRVFEEAARRGVAIELDGTWERQDVDYRLAASALAFGCLFALDSDAHSPRERHFSAIAVAHARLADIPADRVVNCWPLDRLLAWASHARS